MTTPTIAVIMPAYNEAARIERTIGSVARYRAGGAPIGPVIVADDGSDDATIDVATAAAARVGLPLEILRYPHRGKASTVRAAMLEVAGRVTADYLMMLDADDEIRIDQLDGIDWARDPQTIYIAKRVDQVEGSAGVQAVTDPPSHVERDAPRVQDAARDPISRHPVRVQALPAIDRRGAVRPAAFHELDLRRRIALHRAPALRAADPGSAGRLGATRRQQGRCVGGGHQRARDVRHRLASIPTRLSTGRRDEPRSSPGAVVVRS